MGSFVRFVQEKTREYIFLVEIYGSHRRVERQPKKVHTKQHRYLHGPTVRRYVGHTDDTDGSVVVIVEGTQECPERVDVDRYPGCGGAYDDLGVSTGGDLPHGDEVGFGETRHAHTGFDEWVWIECAVARRRAWKNERRAANDDGTAVPLYFDRWLRSADRPSRSTTTDLRTPSRYKPSRPPPPPSSPPCTPRSNKRPWSTPP